MGVFMHDSIIREYHVDLHGCTLTLISRDDTRSYTLRAANVLTHHFENMQQCNVILSVEEAPIEHFASDNASLLLHTRQDAWPVSYDTVPGLTEFLKQEAYKYIVIYASLGLCGWILAKDYTITERNLDIGQSEACV